jgi:hypothetical protein
MVVSQALLYSGTMPSYSFEYVAYRPTGSGSNFQNSVTYAYAGKPDSGGTAHEATVGAAFKPTTLTPYTNYDFGCAIFLPTAGVGLIYCSTSVMCF